MSSEERRELRELRRKCRELEITTVISQGCNKFLRAGVRPATSLICEFIDEHREEFGVVPICRALAVHGVQIAPRTCWAHRVSAPSKRALWDTTITEILATTNPDADGKRPPESLYGSLKMWAHLQRQGIPVARRTVERIMRRNPPLSARTPASSSARCATPRPTAPAKATRSRTQSIIDAGSQYTAIHYGETLMLEGLIPSVGTVRKPRPSTTLDSTPESTPVTRNEVCTIPGMLQP